MMKRKAFIWIVASLLMAPTLRAQSLWTSVDAKFGLAKGLSGFVGGEYRTWDKFTGTDRWAATAGLDYKLCDYVKLSSQYSYIHRHVAERLTAKGNLVDSYWQPRHRAAFAVTGSYKWNRFTFSLRERYQYTYHTGDFYVGKVGANGKVKDDAYIEAKNKHILRSRLKAEYSIRKSGFTPYVSAELYNDLSGFGYDKSRVTAGTEYKFTKHHSIDVFYRYIGRSDSDDIGGHVIGAGYQFKL